MINFPHPTDMHVLIFSHTKHQESNVECAAGLFWSALTYVGLPGVFSSYNVRKISFALFACLRLYDILRFLDSIHRVAIFDTTNPF